jgi:hypothetical protein
MSRVTRTVEVNDLTPEELATLFAEMDGQQQVDFFSEVWKIAKKWPGAGWCQQSYEIARLADNNAIQTIRTLASHLPADDVAWIVATRGEA